MTPKITHVEARLGYKLQVEFDNGEVRLFDVTPYLAKGIFGELRDESYFKCVKLVWSGVEWRNEQDLSADTLYHVGKPIAEPRSAVTQHRSEPSHSPAPITAQRLRRHS